MKLIILKDNLLKGLNFVEKAIGGGERLPVLENVRIEAKENNKIVLTSTDLEMAIQAEVSGKVVEEGTVIIPFDVFKQIVRNLDSEKIELKRKDKDLEVNSSNYQASIKCGEVEEYPVIPSIENRAKSLEISPEVLEEYLSKAEVATKHSDIRPEINGVYFEYGGEDLFLAGTDSFRLVEAVLGSNEFDSNLEEMEMIVPLETVNTVLSNLSEVEGNVEIFVDSNQVKFESENFSVISRLVEGDYPDYKAVIPKSTKEDVVVQREELRNAVKTTRAFSGKANDITLKIGENKKVLQVFSSNNSLGENNYRVPVNIKGEEKEISISFNWRYILDGLKIFDTEEIELGFNESDKPVVMEDDSSVTYVVMPIRS